MLEKKSDQPNTFRTKHWVEVNDESRGTYHKGNQIRFKTAVLRSSSRDYSDAYILIKKTITVAKETDAASSNNNKKVMQ